MRFHPIDSKVCECISVEGGLQIIRIDCNQSLTCDFPEDKKKLLGKTSDRWDCLCTVKVMYGHCAPIEGNYTDNCEDYIFVETPKEHDERFQFEFEEEDD